MSGIAHLSQQERDVLLNSLNEKQREFITEHLKRGRKTVFANQLAKEKAGPGQEENTRIAEQWDLIDYIDAGPNWRENPKYFCECGRSLRYQYVLENKELGQLKKFGMNHFQEHTGISPQLAREIVKGIERIDYEMDEMLIKISNGWTLSDESINEIPSAFVIPDDIQHHLDFDVPLLDRQIIRLKQQMTAYWQEIHRQRREKKIYEEKVVEKQRAEKYQKLKEAVIANLTDGKLQWSIASTSLNKDLQIGVLTYLYRLSEPIFSAKEICKNLVAYHGASSQTFSSGTLRIYPDVCIFLESLKGKGFLEFVEKTGLEDRIYKVLELPQLAEKMHTDLFGMND